MTRKITTILLALALCLTLTPVVATAAGTTDGTPLTDTVISSLTQDGYTYGSNTTESCVLNGGTYYLDGDVTISKPLLIKGTSDNPATLNLNGHVLKLNSNTYGGSVIIVNDGAYFTLTDSNTTSKNYTYTVGSDSKWTLVDSGTTGANTITLTGGVITGGTGIAAGFGGGVFVGSNATFNMTGGNIVGCTASYDGGGVHIAYPDQSCSTTFNMSGGSIVGCTTDGNATGGGVYVDSNATFTMTGGSIESCTAKKHGGGVYNYRGMFTMSDNSTIESCTANGGGGVYNGGMFTMSGNSTIENCTAMNSNPTVSEYGGGVYVCNGTFTMKGGTIQNCTANGTGAVGSGVYIGDFAPTMDAQGGSVDGNVYLIYNNSKLINTSGGDGTNFTGTITNNSGNTKKPSDPTDPTGGSRKFLGWFVKNASGKGYTKVEFGDNGNATTATGDILRAFWEGDFEVQVSDATVGNGYYTSFTDAWDITTGAQGDSPTFTLLKDVNAGTLTCSKRGAKLDLNGKTVSGSITISGESETTPYTLSVKDSAGSGSLEKVTLSGTGELVASSGTVKEVIASGGKIRCAGGTITTATVNTGGTLECSSGTITTATVNTGGTLECSSGTIETLKYNGGTVNHTGGTATCTKQAECSVCGTPYGSMNPTNHAGEQLLLIPAKAANCKNGGNNEYYYCASCDNYFADSAGTRATTAEAEKTNKNPNNHAQQLPSTYQSDKDGHWQVYPCCGVATTKADHTFDGSKCSVCSYEKPRRTYRGSGAPTISAVLSHADAASATDYTSGIYGLTFRSTASFASFRGVQVDGKTIASTNYIAEEGSIVVYLKAAYLQTLPKGSHTVTILSTEGNATANFTVGGVQSAKTGDMGVAIYALMALTSYTGTALVVRGRKRK